jgi:hypothetical protein
MVQFALFFAQAKAPREQLHNQSLARVLGQLENSATTQFSCGALPMLGSPLLRPNSAAKGSLLVIETGPKL